jgi:hypothetical protein
LCELSEEELEGVALSLICLHFICKLCGCEGGVV